MNTRNVDALHALLLLIDGPHQVKAKELAEALAGHGVLATSSMTEMDDVNYLLSWTDTSLEKGTPLFLRQEGVVLMLGMIAQDPDNLVTNYMAMVKAEAQRRIDAGESFA